MADSNFSSFLKTPLRVSSTLKIDRDFLQEKFPVTPAVSTSESALINPTPSATKRKRSISAKEVEEEGHDLQPPLNRSQKYITKTIMANRMDFQDKNSKWALLRSGDLLQFVGHNVNFCEDIFYSSSKQKDISEVEDYQTIELACTYDDLVLVDIFEPSQNISSNYLSTVHSHPPTSLLPKTSSSKKVIFITKTGYLHIWSDPTSKVVTTHKINLSGNNTADDDETTAHEILTSATVIYPYILCLSSFNEAYVLDETMTATKLSPAHDPSASSTSSLLYSFFSTGAKLLGFSNELNKPAGGNKLRYSHLLPTTPATSPSPFLICLGTDLAVWKHYYEHGQEELVYEAKGINQLLKEDIVAVSQSGYFREFLSPEMLKWKCLDACLIDNQVSMQGIPDGVLKSSEDGATVVLLSGCVNTSSPAYQANRSSERALVTLWLHVLHVPLAKQDGSVEKEGSLESDETSSDSSGEEVDYQGVKIVQRLILADNVMINLAAFAPQLQSGVGSEKNGVRGHLNPKLYPISSPALRMFVAYLTPTGPVSSGTGPSKHHNAASLAEQDLVLHTLQLDLVNQIFTPVPVGQPKPVNGVDAYKYPAHSVLNTKFTANQIAALHSIQGVDGIGGFIVSEAEEEVVVLSPPLPSLTVPVVEKTAPTPVKPVVPTVALQSTLSADQALDLLVNITKRRLVVQEQVTALRNLTITSSEPDLRDLYVHLSSLILNKSPTSHYWGSAHASVANTTTVNTTSSMLMSPGLSTPMRGGKYPVYKVDNATYMPNDIEYKIVQQTLEEKVKQHELLVHAAVQGDVKTRYPEIYHTLLRQHQHLLFAFGLSSSLHSFPLPLTFPLSRQPDHMPPLTDLLAIPQVQTVVAFWYEHVRSSIVAMRGSSAEEIQAKGYSYLDFFYMQVDKVVESVVFIIETLLAELLEDDACPSVIHPNSLYLCYAFMVLLLRTALHTSSQGRVSDPLGKHTNEILGENLSQTALILHPMLRKCWLKLGKYFLEIFHALYRKDGKTPGSPTEAADVTITPMKHTGNNIEKEACYDFFQQKNTQETLEVFMVFMLEGFELEANTTSSGQIEEMPGDWLREYHSMKTVMFGVLFEVGLSKARLLELSLRYGHLLGVLGTITWPQIHPVQPTLQTLLEQTKDAKFVAVGAGEEVPGAAWLLSRPSDSFTTQYEEILPPLLHRYGTRKGTDTESIAFRCLEWLDGQKRYYEMVLVGTTGQCPPEVYRPFIEGRSQVASVQNLLDRAYGKAGESLFNLAVNHTPKLEQRNTLLSLAKLSVKLQEKKEGKVESNKNMDQIERELMVVRIQQLLSGRGTSQQQEAFPYRAEELLSHCLEYLDQSFDFIVEFLLNASAKTTAIPVNSVVHALTTEYFPDNSFFLFISSTFALVDILLSDEQNELTRSKCEAAVRKLWLCVIYYDLVDWLLLLTTVPASADVITPSWDEVDTVVFPRLVALFSDEYVNGKLAHGKLFLDPIYVPQEYSALLATSQVLSVSLHTDTDCLRHLKNGHINNRLHHLLLHCVEWCKSQYPAYPNIAHN